MARAQSVEGLRPEMPFCEAARRVIAVRSGELFAHAHGVLDTDDVERVHDMRVATRRLRAALELFASCFPRGPYRSALREVKLLADALGRRRDPDVQIESLEKLRGEMPARNRGALDGVLERLAEEQARANGVVARAVERARKRDLEAQLELLAQRTA